MFMQQASLAARWRMKAHPVKTSLLELLVPRSVSLKEFSDAVNGYARLKLPRLSFSI